MTNLTIIDTDILIDTSRNKSEAIDYLQNLQSTSILAISAVTQMELIVGCTNKADLRKIENFLQQFSIIKIDQDISDRSVELLKFYRLSHGLLIADSLIAATSIVWDYPLATKNQRDYRFIQELKLLPYP
ncbi:MULTISPECIES: type II toxin-antitoxin system VapC family toxin [Pseudanabaena]|jgi:predicted nucleic acid-binding protein|uniref:type II toxin-antitoxin system VapC family toxin n=1 Tax=Pseudanabaena TaxID=1152 RepID=UPI00247A94FE|nr:MULTISPECIES: type II toxin-antitoxin system VapC family toxin [Pseudanabaena]MEA5488402.1 type II toxin-antitoxin system VapC family toxin [Pseudanabaena sp. CCNP1317]WGS70392.1 type II toxin-antitoxin system VapC family toxin [Pseudanabaena galeata CCNP1313]